MNAIEFMWLCKVFNYFCGCVILMVILVVDLKSLVLSVQPFIHSSVHNCLLCYTPTTIAAAVAELFKYAFLNCNNGKTETTKKKNKKSMVFISFNVIKAVATSTTTATLRILTKNPGKMPSLIIMLNRKTDNAYICNNYINKCVQ